MGAPAQRFAQAPPGVNRVGTRFGFDSRNLRRLPFEAERHEASPGRQRETMKKPGRRSARLIALCLLGCLLFNYPVLALFNRPGTFLGVPLLYAWIFGAWVVLIVLMARVVERDD